MPLSSISIAFHPVFSDPEGCIAGGLSLQQEPEIKLFLLLPQRLGGKDELRACVHPQCTCRRNSNIPAGIKYVDDWSPRTVPGTCAPTCYTNLPFPGYEVP